MKRMADEEGQEENIKVDDAGEEGDEAHGLVKV